MGEGGGEKDGVARRTVHVEPPESSETTLRPLDSTVTLVSGTLYSP